MALVDPQWWWLVLVERTGTADARTCMGGSQAVLAAGAGHGLCLFFLYFCKMQTGEIDEGREGLRG